MAETDLVYFDIAAVVVMLVSLVSFLIRRRTKTPANRVYLSTLVLVTLAATFGLVAELYDALNASALEAASSLPTSDPPVLRGMIQMVYYALRSLMAPAYLVLIATVSDTSHRLNNSTMVRTFLWVPMTAVLLFVLTNPLHHMVYTCQGGAVVRGPGVMAIYLSTVYYSAIGVWWLFRWRKVLSDDEFATLMMLYPLVLLAVYVQYYYPHVHVEMFATSVSIMLVAAFVMRPERQMDSLVEAASLQAYRVMCNRAFITQRPLCLVYLGIVNLERLRELVGQDELHAIINRVATSLTSVLETGDILYYLRNGMFCISPVNLDADHALRIAFKTHEEGKARSKRPPTIPSTTPPAHVAPVPSMEMRSCVVRIPYDVSDSQALSTFVRRFSHLVPDSRVTSFEELSMHEDFALNMALSTCIERAIQQRSFQVYYQPILCLEDGRFHSAEALVRLQDPQFGWISPGLFIPEAEQSGAILGIGSILLDKICAFLGQVDYASTGLSYVEVNLSTEQCIRPQMALELLELMRAHGVDPSRINLEITETSSSFSQRIIERNVRTLAESGVTFSLDDYGTGYSNIARALSLPFDLIKFDKSFVDNMGDSATSTVLAQSIAMMKQVGKQVLVEGVETAAQAKALRAMGADYIQGYLYSRPLPQEEFVSFLLKHNA
ncbi:MAG: EAL domain-containing protein [Coriobacteriales bacterium]|nr:EAL domain-containing protein [Coriobacteriales bacterium]